MKRKSFCLIVVVVVVLLIMSCKNIVSKENEENSFSSSDNHVRSYVSTPHNYILKYYVDNYDDSHWMSFMELHSDEFVINGTFDMDKFARFFLNNIETFYDEKLWAVAFDNACEVFKLDVPNPEEFYPFSEEIIKKYFDIDDIYGGYNFAQLGQSQLLEYSDFINNELGQICALPGEQDELYSIIKMVHLDSVYTNNDIVVYVDDILTSNTLSPHYIELLKYIRNEAMFADVEENNSDSFRTIFNPLDAAGKGYHYEINIVCCNQCNPDASPHGISHEEHLLMASLGSSGTSGSLWGMFRAVVSFVTQ